MYDAVRKADVPRYLALAATRSAIVVRGEGGLALLVEQLNSDDEDRFIMLGISFTLRVLVVCHCYREDDSVIRIISARKADKREQSDYWS